MAGSRKRVVADALGEDPLGAAEHVLRTHVRRGDRVTVGLSGGVDSIALLDILRLLAPGLGITLSALHVDHGLNPDAAAWVAFCRRHCRRRGIPFVAIPVEVDARGGSIEARAREARYRAFAAHAAGWIALAHHRDDQAETVLLRLIRGAGARGLAGMPAVRPVHMPSADGAVEGLRLLRPLLEVGRDAILAYARRRRLRWVEDGSNAAVRFDRNFLRQCILPVLDQRFPGCRDALARSAGHLREADAVLSEVAAADLEAATREGGIDLDLLMRPGPARAALALRLALERGGEPAPSARRLNDILLQFRAAGADASPQVRLTRVELRRYRGLLVIRPAPASDGLWQRVSWDGGAVQRLPDDSLLIAQPVRGEGVSQASLNGHALSLRRRQGGERMRLRAGGPSRTLKNLLQERAVPPWQRDAMPLLYCGEQLVWVPAVGVASRFLARPDEPGLCFAWRPA